MKRKFIYLLLFVVLILGLYRIYDRLTDDFQVSHITYALPNRAEWQTSPPTAQVEEILKQPFSYLGKGSQCYVFKSRDQKYVLKFFKFKHTKPNRLLNALPHIGPIAALQDYREARHQKKINRLFVGYKIAYDYDLKESGLIYLHLNQNPPFDKTITVYDKLGFKRDIPLKDTFFIIQEAAVTTQEVLTKALENNDTSLVKKRVDQLIAMYIGEYQKGIYDKDHAILRNTGFIGDRPIHFDVGNFVVDPAMKDPAVYKKDLEIVLKNLNTWIEEKTSNPGH